MRIEENERERARNSWKSQNSFDSKLTPICSREKKRQPNNETTHTKSKQNQTKEKSDKLSTSKVKLLSFVQTRAMQHSFQKTAVLH